MKYALALAGGGTKGSYQIGVWKALKELGIEVEAIAGTSVGAINGGAIASGNFEKTKDLWEKLDYSYMISHKPSDEKNFFLRKYENIKEQILDIVEKRGLDITPLRKLLNEVVDEQKIRESGIDLIVTTVSLSEFKPLQLGLADIPEGQLIDYITASAALPIFQKIEIDGKSYLDGGVYDNLPINILLEKGYKSIIAVDLKHTVGIKQKVNDNNAKIIYIANSSMTGGVLEFNKDQAKQNVKMGYLDTMKAFGKNYGKKYFLKDEKEPKYTYPITNAEVDYIFNNIEDVAYVGESAHVLKKRLLRNIRKYTNEHLNDKNVIISALEIAAEMFNINKIEQYSSDELVERIMKKYFNIINGVELHQKNLLIFKKYFMKYMLKDNEFPNPLLILTMPKFFITNLFILLMEKRIENL